MALVATCSTACGGDPQDTSVDAGGDDHDANGCARPSLEPVWLEDYATEIIEKLTGASEISPGVTLTDRASAQNRNDARDYISDQLQAWGYEVMIDAYGSGANVVGELSADQPVGEVVLLGAHFDGVPSSPGANDNASGVALVLATARAIAESDCRQRDLLVALFDEEEIGLVGSQNLAALLSEAEVPLVSVHTVDQMGWDSDGDRTVELELPALELEELYTNLVAEHELDIPLSPTTVTSSDHQAFRLEGYRCTGLTEEYIGGDTTPHYHTPGDTAATVDIEYLASSARLVIAAMEAQLDAELSTRVDPSRRSVLEALRAARPERVVRGPWPGYRPRR